MFSRRISMLAIALFITLCSGCATRSYDTVPDAIESQVDQSVTFKQLKESPDTYRGRVLTLGGEVLSAKRMKEGTRIEVLQLPLDSQGPGHERTASEGRFFAFQKEFLDPAKLPPGTRVTITGEVTGSQTQPLDETQYTYPTLDIKHLTISPEVERYRARPYPYPGPYWGPYGAPYGPMGPYGPYGWGWGRYPYWW